MATAIPTAEPGILRGVRLDDIPDPSEVTAFLEKVQIPPDERREWERQHTLSFLYGGKEVACRELPDGGIEILYAAGLDDYVAWRDSLTREQRTQISYNARPRRWEAILWDAGIRPRRRWFFFW